MAGKAEQRGQHPRADLSSRVQIVRVVEQMGVSMWGTASTADGHRLRGQRVQVGCLVYLFDPEAAGAWHKGKPRG